MHRIQEVPGWNQPGVGNWLQSGLIAGAVNLARGVMTGGQLPELSAAVPVGLVGFLSYGVSLVLFVYALRHLGTARTGAYFSTAPFQRAIAALALLQDALIMQLLAAGLLMALGIWLHVSGHHKHQHVHEPVQHAHPHVHDQHHQHEHAQGDPAGEPHPHPRRHERQKHRHPPGPGHASPKTSTSAATGLGRGPINGSAQVALSVVTRQGNDGACPVRTGRCA